jgi:uncharacterized protein YjdB
MKKLFTFLTAFLMATSLVRAVPDLVLEDFESGAATYFTGTAYPSWVGGATSPTVTYETSTVGTNTTMVMKYVPGTGFNNTWSGIKADFSTPPITSDHIKLSIDVYVTKAVSIQAEIGVNWGNWTKINKTPAVGVWTTLEYDISSFTRWDYNQIYIYNSTDMQDGIIYFDNIKLVAKPSTPPTSISLTPDNISLLPGKYFQLTKSYLPNNSNGDVTYTSSDPSVATVNATGVVTSVATGTTTITATSAVDAAITATSTITVTAADVSNSFVLANFENRLPFAAKPLAAWNNSVPPTVTVVANPSKSGINTSDSVLEIKDATQWEGIEFQKHYPANQYNKIRFKVMATTDISDFGIQAGLSNLADSIKPQALVANTWYQMTFVIAKQNIATDWTLNWNPLMIKKSSGDNTTFATFYIDDVQYIAGDANLFVPVTGVDFTSTDTIKTDGGVLNLVATSFSPITATNHHVTWSLPRAGDSDTAIINSENATLQGVRNGKVLVKMTSVDGNFFAIDTVIITNQIFKLVESVNITSGDTIKANHGTLALTAEVLPADADVQSVTWSIVSSDADTASISGATLTAIRNGKVTVRATSDSNPAIYAEKEITITNQPISVTAITVAGADITDGTFSTMTATVVPANAAEQGVTWSVSDATIATIDATGKLTALKNGTVTVTATTKESGSTITGTRPITISGVPIKVTAITVAGADITTNGGSSDMTATIAPADATEQGVTWSVSDATIATIDATGKLTALRNDTVTVTATTKENGSTISGTKSIIITGQIVKVTAITVTGANITTNGGSSAMTATVAPTDATEKGVTWAVSDATIATIDATGKLTALKNGTVTVTATTKENGSTIKGTKVVTISGQLVKVTGITITTAGNVTDIPLKGTLKLTGSVLPADATDKTVTWTTSDATKATVAADGTVTAVAIGTVTITATANDGSTKTGTISLTISGQTGIGSIIDGKLQIFPNPVIDVLNIENADGVKKVEIINCNGLVVKVVEIHTQSAAISVQSLKAGFYIAKAFTDRGICVSAFIKK